ncbi:MAG: PAC2 family protein, partial [Candidatus Heimdallarchaeota archaeon]|nr:PAC2 family protein [Candidatus Heimdallarchaeota archaeon]
PYKNEHRLFAHGLIRWAISRELARVVVIGGLDSRLRTNEDVFAKCVYSAAYNDLFPNPQIPMMDEGLFITGPMALVLMYAEINNFPALGILPYAERSRPDPIGASHAVEILNDLLGTECGVQDLVREAENIENELQSIEGVLQEEAEDQDDRDKGMFM